MYKCDRRWRVVSIVLLKMSTIFVYVIPVIYVRLMHRFQRIYFAWKLIHHLNYFRFLPNSQVKEVYNTKVHRYMNSDDIHLMRWSYAIKPQICVLTITHSMIRRFDAFSNRISFVTYIVT